MIVMPFAVKVVSASVTARPPPFDAVFGSATVPIVVLPWTSVFDARPPRIAPPLPFVAALLRKSLSVTVVIEPMMRVVIAPPPPSAVFPVKSLSVISAVPPKML